MARNEAAPVNERAPDQLDPAMGVLRGALDRIGADRIALATVARSWVCVQPVRLDDGEQIARMLGCTNPLDHRLLVPGHTLWTGTSEGLELQVRSALRGPTRAAW
ncbi:hypothetical protein GCM10027059_22680 [Myceligenerans halotolerans]